MSRFARQSFLGSCSEAVLREATIGYVGLGGGGSHLVQQSGHVGIGGHVLVDPDHITETNTNRLVGGKLADVKTETPKVKIAERLLSGIQEAPRIIPIHDSWHNAAEELKYCDIIVGAVDSFVEREQLERFARRHLIPYIDIGMDVHEIAEGSYLIGGQIILSMPGRPCLRCCGLITDDRLAEEAKRYGAAGERPQVIWPNGVLASTAVGLAVQILTPWFQPTPEFVFLDYDGNTGTVTPNVRMDLLRDKACPHHPLDETGDPLFDVSEFVRSREASASPIQRAEGWTRHWWRNLRHLLLRRLGQIWRPGGRDQK